MYFYNNGYRLVTAVVLLAACDLRPRGPGTGVDNSVTQVLVSPDTLTLDPFQSFQFRVFGRTKAGDSVPVSVRWVTSAGAISQAGTYSADTSAADAMVTATLTSSAVSGTSRVRKRRVVRLLINPKNTALKVGGLQQFSVYGRNNMGDSVSVPVTYAATGGTVSGSGWYTAGQTAGPYRVIANQTGGLLADTSAVTLSTIPVASVVVSPASGTLAPGGTLQLSASTLDSASNPLTGRAVSWSSSAPGVAMVSASGLVTGVAAGNATITATSEGRNGTAAITVAVVPVASVTVTPATASIAVGQATQLTATPKDGSGNPLSGRVVTWASSAPAVASVNGGGLVTGVAAGSATITASSEGQSGSAAGTVSPAVTNPGTVSNLAVASVTPNSVTLSFTEVTGGAGQPASYDVRYAAAPLSWGTASSVTNGTCATPLAGSAIGATRTCTVAGLAAATSYQFQLVAFRGTLNVDAVFGAASNVASGTTANSTAPVATVTVSPASVSLGVGATQSLTATLRDASSNILTGRTVTWSSSAPLLATVGGSGLLTGVAVGTATITATSEGQSGSAAVTVTALPPPPPPPPPGGEPVFNVVAGDLMILGVNMDAYTSPAQMDVIPGPSIHGFYDALSPCCYFVIAPGHAGSLKAIRLVYDSGPQRNLWKTNPENSNWYAPANAAIVVQYWFRISKNGGPGGSPGYGSTAVGMKWVEFWRMGQSDRTQFGPTAGNATTGPLWSLHSGGSSLIMGYQPVGPYWNQLNDNQWHRATYLLQPASAPGATDGVARMWVDGTKIVDISAAAAGVTPPGGTKVWCTMAEVAQLDTYQTGTINLGEYMNGRLGDGVTDLPMTLDFDDFAWWRLAARVP